MLGVTLPDPKLKWNEERQHHDYGEIDWDEFWSTVNGNGPCNHERLATRVKAHNDGRWVREAALAYARKRQNEKPHGTDDELRSNSALSSTNQAKEAA